MTDTVSVMDSPEEDADVAGERPAEPREHGDRTTPRNPRSFASVVIATCAVVLVLIVHAVTSPGGVAPSPLAASEPLRSARDDGSRRPLPPPPPREPSLRPDPRGPLFTAVGGHVRRLRPASPGRGVALIFDDGPGSQTEQAVRELRRAGATATFFLVGREAERRPELVRRLRAAGMELGNHSHSHSTMGPLPERDQRTEVRMGGGAIERAAGIRPRFFRPPHIGWNAATARAVTAEGEVGVLHTIDPHDWAGTGRADIASSIRGVKPGDIVALHDAGGDRTETIAALRPMLQALARRRLRCVTVSQLVGYPLPGTLPAERVPGQRGVRVAPPG